MIMIKRIRRTRETGAPFTERAKEERRHKAENSFGVFEGEVDVGEEGGGFLENCV